MGQQEIEVYEPPKRGTGAWLAQQEHVEVLGLRIPNVHRVPDGATAYEGEDDGRCRIVREDGRRCGATRMRAYGICSAHAGGGDPEAASLAGNAQRARLKARRLMLGIGPATAANPRQIARLAAQARAEEIAAALIDGPLDDRELGSLERQQAMLRGLDATFPLQQMTVEVELPADADGVGEMGWEDMQRLAASVLAAPALEAGGQAEDQ